VGITAKLTGYMAYSHRIQMHSGERLWYMR